MSDVIVSPLALRRLRREVENGNLPSWTTAIALINEVERLRGDAASREWPSGHVPVATEVVRFLSGNGALDGVWFGDVKEGQNRLWWRAHLPVLRPVPNAPPPPPYSCHGRPPAGDPWKEGGRCQHDSADDPRCSGCPSQRTVSTRVPQDGTGGVP